MTPKADVDTRNVDGVALQEPNSETEDEDKVEEAEVEQELCAELFDNPAIGGSGDDVYVKQRDCGNDTSGLVDNADEQTTRQPCQRVTRELQDLQDEVCYLYHFRLCSGIDPISGAPAPVAASTRVDLSHP